VRAIRGAALCPFSVLGVNVNRLLCTLVLWQLNPEFRSSLLTGAGGANGQHLASVASTCLASPSLFALPALAFVAQIQRLAFCVACVLASYAVRPTRVWSLRFTLARGERRRSQIAAEDAQPPAAIA
jgi:hypothetical protein